MLALFLPLFWSCNDSLLPDKSMAFKNVEYIEAFPHVYHLSGDTVPDIDIIGINDFCVVDSMMVFSLRGSDSLWAFYSLPEYRLLGRCLTRGDGPNEFVQIPGVSFKTDFFRNEGELSAVIYDSQKGRALKLDVNAVLKSFDHPVSVLCDNLPPFLFNFIAQSDTSFFCKGTNASYNQQIRYIKEPSGEFVPSVLESLNAASVDDGMKNINIISTISRMNHDNGLIVEMPIGLNYINIYSLSGHFSKTICIGKKLYDISDIESQDFEDRIYTYSDLCVYKQFWAVVSIGEDMKTFQTGRKHYPSLLLFDWNGSPLAKLDLNRFITSFDIDVANGTLYTFDTYTDELRKYDIGYILKDIFESLLSRKSG